MFKLDILNTDFNNVLDGMKTDLANCQTLAEAKYMPMDWLATMMPPALLLPLRLLPSSMQIVWLLTTTPPAPPPLPKPMSRHTLTLP